jgi:L-fuculose-phosphate aldolase
MNVDMGAVNDVLAVAKRLDEKVLANAYEGNVSLKRDGLLYITPAGKVKGWLTEEMICVIDVQGRQVFGEFAPSSELKMHTAVYAMRGDIGGIVHAHPPYLTAYAMCGMPFVNKAHAEMLWDHKVIEVAPYGRPGSEEIYAGIRPILEKGKDVLLLANHGALAVGKTVFDAQNKMESVENAAMITAIAKQIGPLAQLPDDEVQALLDM